MKNATRSNAEQINTTNKMRLALASRPRCGQSEVCYIFYQII